MEERVIAESLDMLAGGTPLLRIGYLSERCGMDILAKAEFLNPAGSVKDRIAVRMIDMALRRGEIGPDTVVIEATSGNTGIALASVCAAKGLRLIIVMPESMSIERYRLMKHLGAEVVLTPGSRGMEGAVAEAKRLADSRQNVFLARQFENPDNPDAHFYGTGPEIIEQIGAIEPAFFVAGVGTGGTLTGTARALKELFAQMGVAAVEPAGSAVLSGGEAGEHGIQGIGAGFVPDILDTEMIDRVVRVSDEDAIDYAREAAKRAGLLIGISSGANLAAAEIIAGGIKDSGKAVVTILPDGAERYLSGALLEDAE